MRHSEFGSSIQHTACTTQDDILPVFRARERPHKTIEKVDDFCGMGRRRKPSQASQASQAKLNPGQAKPSQPTSQPATLLQTIALAHHAREAGK